MFIQFNSPESKKIWNIGFWGLLILFGLTFDENVDEPPFTMWLWIFWVVFGSFITDSMSKK